MCCRLLQGRTILWKWLLLMALLSLHFSSEFSRYYLFPMVIFKLMMYTCGDIVAAASICREYTPVGRNQGYWRRLWDRIFLEIRVPNKNEQVWVHLSKADDDQSIFRFSKFDQRREVSWCLFILMVTASFLKQTRLNECFSYTKLKCGPRLLTEQRIMVRRYSCTRLFSCKYQGGETSFCPHSFSQ
jgi:hypothetical protein